MEDKERKDGRKAKRCRTGKNRSQGVKKGVHDTDEAMKRREECVTKRGTTGGKVNGDGQVKTAKV